MLCILMHEGIEHDLAMSFGDEFHPDKVFAYQLREFAENIGINFKLVSQTVKKLCEAPIKAMEKEIMQQLKSLIVFRATNLKVSALEMSHVSW